MPFLCEQPLPDSGYQLIWVLWWCTVAGLLLQILAARLGVTTGLNLAQTCRQEYPRCPSMALWIMTEIAIIGSDIQEVGRPSLHEGPTYVYRTHQLR